MSIRPSAATATTAGGCTLLRPAISVGFLDFALDPDHGKNQDRCLTVLRGAIHGWAQPPRSRIRWKFNDGAHAQTLSTCRFLRDLRRWSSLRTNVVNGFLICGSGGLTAELRKPDVDKMA